jgi:hypothetical protein
MLVTFRFIFMVQNHEQKLHIKFVPILSMVTVFSIWKIIVAPVIYPKIMNITLNLYSKS